MNNKIRLIVFSALVAAVDIIFSRIINIDLPGPIRINFEISIAGLAGYLLGPVWASLSLVASDLIGMLLYTGSMGFSLFFTISAALRGILFGILLYKKPVRITRSILSILIVFLLVDFLLNTYWLSIMMELSYFPYLISRLPKLILIPINTALLHILLILINKILKFDKNPIVRTK